MRRFLFVVVNFFSRKSPERKLLIIYIKLNFQIKFIFFFQIFVRWLVLKFEQTKKIKISFSQLSSLTTYWNSSKQTNWFCIVFDKFTQLFLRFHIWGSRSYDWFFNWKFLILLCCFISIVIHFLQLIQSVVTFLNCDRFETLGKKVLVFSIIEKNCLEKGTLGNDDQHFFKKIKI